MELANSIIMLYEAAVIDTKNNMIYDERNMLLILKYFYIKLKSTYASTDIQPEPLIQISTEEMKPHAVIRLYLYHLDIGIDENIPCSHFYRRVDEQSRSLTEVVIRNIENVLETTSGKYEILAYEDCEFKEFKKIGDKLIYNLLKMQSIFEFKNKVLIDVYDEIGMKKDNTENY